MDYNDESVFGQDDWLDELRDMADDILRQEDEHGSVSIIDPKRLSELQLSAKKIGEALDGSCATVKTKVDLTSCSWGVIEIVGNEIRVADPIRFCEAVELADCLEIEENIDGSTYIALTYHDIKVRANN